jgi:hypothetical protein
MTETPKKQPQQKITYHYCIILDLEALSMDDGWARLIIFTLGYPHLQDKNMI